MFELDLYSIGDLRNLQAALNGVALLAQADLFVQLFSIALLLAVLWYGLTAMARMQRGIPWGHFIIAFIVFHFMFSTPATVWVHDAYSLRSVQVDNVPYGIAVAGSFMSKISYVVTEKLEQAFSTPHLLETGFVEPLQILSRVKQLPTGLEGLQDGKVKRTLVEYVQKCTSVGINLGQVSEGQIRNSEDPWEAMKWNSSIYYTMTWLPGDPAGGTLRTCTEAWEVINEYLSEQMWLDWNDFLKSIICPGEACDPVGKVQQALVDLDLTTHSAYNYMLAAVVLPVFEQGQMQFFSEMGKPEMAVIVGQAREQRKKQWLAEAPLFLATVRPLLAFFEVFMYASTPFVALLIAFSIVGLQAIGRYFKMFAWVASWMPVLALVNFFAQLIMQDKLAALVNGNIPLTSLSGFAVGVTRIDEWLAVASLLAASTPALALGLVYGGSIAVSHLAGRLQAGDYIDETIAAPKVVSPPPLLNQQAPFSAAPFESPHRTGAVEVMPKYSVSDVMAKQQQSSRAEVVAASQAFSTSLQRAMGKSMQATYGGTVTEAFRDGYQGTVTETEAIAHGLANKIGSFLNLNTQERHTLQGILSGSMEQGLKSEGGGASIGVKMSPQLQSAFGTEKGQQIAEAINQLLTQSGESSLQAAGMETLARDFSRQQAQSYLAGLSQSDLEQLQKSAEQKLAAERRYQETAQLVQQFGSGTTVDAMKLAKVLAEAKGESQRYWEELGRDLPNWISGPNRMGVRVNRMDELVRYYQRTLGVADPEVVRWLATLHRLNEFRGPGEEVAQKHLANLLLTGVQRGVPVVQPGQFKGVAGQAEEAGAAAAERAQGLKPVEGVQEGIAGIKGQAMAPLPDRGEVRGWSTDWQNYIDERRLGQMRKDWATKYARAIDAAYEQFAKDPTASQVLTEGAAAFGRWAEKRLREIKALGSSVFDAVGSLDPSKINWPGARQDFYKYALSRGMTQEQANLYATAAIAGIDAWTRNKYNFSVANTADYEKARDEFIAKKAAILQERGMSPEDSQRVAQREAHMITAAGITGIDYLKRAEVGEKDWQQLQRFRLSMGPGGRYEHLIQESAQRHGVDPGLIRAVIKAESGFNPQATSSKGAMGLMQLTPATAQAMRVKDPYDPAQNIEGGTKYLRRLLGQFNGNVALALAAYNAGPEAVAKHGGIPPIAETQNYVSSVLSEWRNAPPERPKGKKIM